MAIFRVIFSKFRVILTSEGYLLKTNLKRFSGFLAVQRKLRMRCYFFAKCLPHRVLQGAAQRGGGGGEFYFIFAVLRTRFSRSKTSLFYLKTCTLMKGAPWSTARLPYFLWASRLGLLGLLEVGFRPQSGSDCSKCLFWARFAIFDFATQKSQNWLREVREVYLWVRSSLSNFCRPISVCVR